MSLIINGLDMPNDCCQCKLARYDDYENETFCPFTDVMCLSIGRQDNCPLEEVPETHDKRTETHACDLISRQALCEYALNQKDKSVTPNDIMRFPSAQPEQRTCVNCGRTVNNGGWYADGRTRCPIEEHYALPKDGYCHLWEKRNVTDDDYPERREG